ncbi:hypothetical protein NLJ89_g2605 [Agrocybe chaxingu]|uniref:DUF6534 domain-containing protein n=1 Tax=Agrocybe chaxingu TaxID=84603 RepID=A0A9W8MXZ9_9AGAR|nr:hypothetical protein NLJ89_g2605 [Agrocybe chaxingu]
MADIGTIKFNVGAVLIGSYVNLVLYTLELRAFYTYLRCERSRRDRKPLKATVFSCVFIDTVGTFAACAAVFTEAVIYWGDPSDLGQMHWTNALWFVANQVVALGVQGFMVTRYFKLVVLVGALLTDALITIALIWHLRLQKVYSDNTKNIVRRLSSLAIRSGLATCMVVLATFITFVIDPTSSLSNGIAFVVARVYSLTMLFTLNSREGICEDVETHFDTSGNIAISEPHASLGSELTEPTTPSTEHSEDIPITFARGDVSHMGV